MTGITIHIDPRRTALIEGAANDCVALVRIGAPPAPPASTKRKALNLALVIDRSGSMSGKPLAEATRCAAMIVDRLTPEDHAAIVVYDNRVDVLVPAQAVTDRATFHRALAEVRSGGTTALFDGWMAGAQQAASGADGDFVTRVMLLSDGCANRGLTQIPEIAASCRQLATAGVSTSTCGLGLGFNEELMVAMATAGQGQSYYGETAEDLMDPFTEEFDLLRALYARRLRLGLQAAPGVELQLLNDYPRGADGAWALPDLAYGAEVWALVSLRIPAALCGAGANIDTLLRATITAQALSDGTQMEATGTLTLGTAPAAVHATLADDARVAARAQELRAADLQLQARQAAQQGNWERVDDILRAAEQEAADNPWVAEGIKALRVYASARERERFAKEAMYKSRRMNTRMAAATESLAYSASEESALPSYLRRKRQQGKREEPAGDRS